jgi:hypothetical protein
MALLQSREEILPRQVAFVLELHLLIHKFLDEGGVLLHRGLVPYSFAQWAISFFIFLISVTLPPLLVRF